MATQKSKAPVAKKTTPSHPPPPPSQPEDTEYDDPNFGDPIVDYDHRLPCALCGCMDAEYLGVFCDNCGKFFCAYCWKNEGVLAKDAIGQDTYLCEWCFDH